MSGEDNVRAIQGLYAAFGRGDVPSILDMVASDVEWKHPRAADIPWGGARSGREAVGEFFAAVAESVEFQEFQPEEFIAQGDRVIVLGHEQMRATCNGSVYRVDWVHAFRLCNGRVMAFCEYTDTATIVEALARREDLLQP